MNSLLRYLWVLPATLVGVVAALPWLACGARARIAYGLLEVGGGAMGHALRRFGFGAITLGHVVIGLDAQCLEACRSHEHVHVRQYERWGALFFPLYLAAGLLAWLRGGQFYRDNAFEREARALEAALRRDTTRID